LRYHVGRNGNHLVIVFQCDDCVFLNLLQRRPLPHSPQDNLTLCCIRRLNLDALWGRETTTVNSTARAVRQTVALLQPLGIQPQYRALGPFPLEDTLGYGVTVAMLLKSLESGRYDTYQQFATIRKLRAGYHNVYMSSSVGANSLRSVGGDKTKHFLNTCPTHSGWFEMFALGYLRRMGQEIHQDHAVSLLVMHALFSKFSREWDNTPLDNTRQHLWIASLASYCVVCFCGSFRGPEGFLVNLYGLCKYINTQDMHLKWPLFVSPLSLAYRWSFGSIIFSLLMTPSGTCKGQPSTLSLAPLPLHPIMNWTFWIAYI
jgi:hypothetical protein